MNRNYRIALNILLILLLLIGQSVVKANKQDTVYLFSYSTDEGRSGLLLAWSRDSKEWSAIGPEHRFLFSDFGRWGSQKRMFSPFLFRDSNENWHCIWTLNNDITQFAHAGSEDLVKWSRQSYPEVMPGGNVKELEVKRRENEWQVTWVCDAPGKEGIYKSYTSDFKNYTPAERGSGEDRMNLRTEVEINGSSYRGVINKVPWDRVAELIKHMEWVQFHDSERAEVMADDPTRFAGLGPLHATISPRPEASKEISDMLIGVFFEDINYAADGGIYAELIQNRGFEYQPGDRSFRDETWTAKKAWKLEGSGTFDIDTVNPVHRNNSHYAALEITETGAALVNEGWDGIPVKQNESYLFSMFARSQNGNKGFIEIRLEDENGKKLGETRIRINGSGWKRYESEITSTGTSPDAKLMIVPTYKGRVDLDMVSLFPKATFMNRKNGLRADLAEVVADLKPRFVRFPGGCVAHGDGLANMYRWENTIGPLEARVPQRNIWGYHQSGGLGYFEYFQFCEDIGAEPLPVVPAGVPCQNSGTGGHGQQCGIPMEEMHEYTQSILNLIEWANGDKKSEWGKKRAEAGHPEPFNLKYIGIGNEDLITDVFEERFTMIFNTVKEKHPEITIIGTVGPFYMGTDYDEGWELARKLEIPMVDEHYYQPPGWFINNQDFYDKYDRNGTRVYLGEYASHVAGRRRNIETSLSEALYLTAVERNADVVEMTSYAPLLAKEGHINWNPDLIYFNNTEVKPSVDYYVQQLYGHHSGNRYIPAQVKLSNNRQNVTRRFGVSMVTDEETGDLIIKLVNLLPVDINSTIDLGGFNITGAGVSIVLKGEPGDENARPEEKVITVDKNFRYTVPGYSFCVIRLSME